MRIIYLQRVKIRKVTYVQQKKSHAIRPVSVITPLQG